MFKTKQPDNQTTKSPNNYTMRKKLLLIAAMLASTAGLLAQSIEMLNNTTAELRLKDGGRVYVDFYGPHTFRIFEDPKGGVIRDPEAQPEAKILVDNPRRNPGRVRLEGNVVSTDEISVRMNLETAQFAVLKGGKVVLEQVLPTEFGKKATTVTLSQGKDDYFFGGGVQNGRFSHRGEAIDIVNTNSWVDGGVCSPAPYYWSTGGYGLMWHTFRPGRYDFGSEEAGKTVLSHETDYLDLFVMVNEGQAVPLLNDYYQITGNPVLLPKFGFYQGHLNAYNRDFWTPSETGFMAYEDGKRYNESQKDNGGVQETLNGEKGNYQFSARAAIDRYLDNDFPLGWFLPNDGYGAGYGRTGSLDGNIQNLKEFGDYARSRGVEIGLWTQSDLHPKEGVEPLLQRDIIKEVHDAGVRVLKTDVAWVGAGYSFGLNGVNDVAQVMPYYGNDARPFIITLDGWAGTQRYAGIWTGDQTGGEWEYIRFHIPTYIGSGLAGQPNVTSDMDGIFGGMNVPVNVRDFQWKTYTPMQLNMDGWGSSPKYPQAQGKRAAEINRYYLKLKSVLLPYAYTIAREAVDGKPMIRAMFLEEENAFTLGKRTEYQFMYGPYILVAPIYKETRVDKDGNDERDGIYLPKGEWVDYFTGDVYEGGRIINNFAAPLWKLPVLIKRGAIIPVHKPTNTPKELDPKYRAYEIYPLGKSEFTEYDDDAKTQAYLAGKAVTTTVRADFDGKRLVIGIDPAKGEFEGFERMKSTVLRVYSSTGVKKIAAKVGKASLKLTQAQSWDECVRTPGSYFWGINPNDMYVTAASVIVNLPEVDVTADAVTVTIDGVSVDNSNKLLKSTGALSKVEARCAPHDAYAVRPEWKKLANADYYEVEFEGQIYSNITAECYEIDGLRPETDYALRVRAVNKDGRSEWTDLSVRTEADPLRFAVRGARAVTSCANQPGQGVDHLFDFDLTSAWHTDWNNNPKAVPFDLTVDLRSVNTLDKLQYVPRADAGNGTITKGTYQWSMDKLTWSEPVEFVWERNGDVKELAFPGNPVARFVRLHVTEAVGDFGSGSQMYIFRVGGSEYYIPGDINKDGRVDENDLTSFMNYTGLRKGDGDFDYISKGDLNGNGLIDVYDISSVAVELEGGVSSRMVPAVEGVVTLKADKASYKVGDEVRIAVEGKGLKSVNGISLAIPYDTNEYEYLGVEATGVSQMYNMTYDRLHTNHQKALYPTFVNLGEQIYAEGDMTVMVLKFRAKKAGKCSLVHKDGLLVDKNQNVVKF